MTNKDRNHVIILFSLSIIGTVLLLDGADDYPFMVAAVINLISLVFISIIVGVIPFGIFGLITKKFSFPTFIKFAIAACIAFLGFAIYFRYS